MSIAIDLLLLCCLTLSVSVQFVCFYFGGWHHVSCREWVIRPIAELTSREKWCQLWDATRPIRTFIPPHPGVSRQAKKNVRLFPDIFILFYSFPIFQCLFLSAGCSFTLSKRSKKYRIAPKNASQLKGGKKSYRAGNIRYTAAAAIAGNVLTFLLLLILKRLFHHPQYTNSKEKHIL